MKTVMRFVYLPLIVGLSGGPFFAYTAEPGKPEPFQMVPATEPGTAAATIILQDGFRAELIAAEPLVTDPVDIAYDENGLAYVAEMTDYPYVDPADDRPWEEQTSKPIGRVRVLEDTNGDGVYDRSDILAEGLSWPAGIACWKGGVYVAATPDVLYLKDTDGDRKADIRRVVFKGFRKYNVQAVMNNLEWGLDHRIYAAGSSNGGTIVSGDPEAAGDHEQVMLGRNDYRFNPVDEKFEVVAGGARFGNSFDDWGHRFLCNIRNPVQQVLFPAYYQQRNRSLLLPSSLHDAAAAGDAVAVYRTSPPEPWRVLNAERQANSSEKTMYDATQATGYVTSSSGVTIYRGAAYPPEFAGNAFVGEVAGNLAIRYVLQPDGVTFTAHRPYDKVDFLASTDNWFRGVNFANAPDGTLHVLDMYRQTIEHPWSLPDDLQERLDLTEGRDRGRIYRLLPPEFAKDFVPPPKPQLGSATIAELVDLLANPNGWWRDTAHRLIYERQDTAAVPLLHKLLTDSPSPLARMHALWSLQGLNALTNADVLRGLHDSDPRVQTHAVQLAEPFLKQDAAILKTVQKLAASDSMPLRFQVALSLGEAPSEGVTQTLADLLRQNGADAWLRAAALSSLGGQELPLLRELLEDPAFATSDVGRALTQEILQTVAASHPVAEIEPLLDRLAESQFDTTAGNSLRALLLPALGRGLKRQGLNLTSFQGKSSGKGIQMVERSVDQIVATVSDSNAAPAERLSVIPLLEFVVFPTALETLAPFVNPRVPVPLQVAAISTLTTFPDDRVADLLLEQYRSLSPAQQQLIVDRLLLRTNWLTKLFAAMEAGQVAANRVPGVRQEIYLKSPNVKLREQAERLFASQKSSPRGPVVEKYLQSLPIAVDAVRGRAVYQKNCANCHRVGAEGYEVGPHLSTVRNRGIGELVVSILDPNREISPNYLTYVVTTEDGLAQTGVVVSETTTNITLRGADKKEISILRDDIDEIQNTGQSLMPVGLEKTISPQELADLIAFLKAQ